MRPSTMSVLGTGPVLIHWLLGAGLGKSRQVYASLGKWADTLKSWPTGLLTAGLGRSRQI